MTTHSNNNTKDTISIPAAKTIDIINKYCIHAHPDKPSYNHKQMNYYVFRGPSSLVNEVFIAYKIISLAPLSSVSDSELTDDEYLRLTKYIEERKNGIGFNSNPTYKFYFLHKVYELPNAIVDKSLQSFYYTNHSFYIKSNFNQIVNQSNEYILNNQCESEYDETKRNTNLLQRKYRESIVKTRIGQGAYREKLINKYGCKCMLCDISLKQMLIASHIKEFSESTKAESLDINNGLLLCANHDKLFDQHLISFDSTGEIIISDKLHNIDLNQLNIKDTESINITDNIEKYMSYHRNKL